MLVNAALASIAGVELLTFWNQRVGSSMLWTFVVAAPLRSSRAVLTDVTPSDAPKPKRKWASGSAVVPFVTSCQLWRNTAAGWKPSPTLLWETFVPDVVF